MVAKTAQFAKKVRNVVELIFRRLFNRPIFFPEVEEDEGTPQGPVLESQNFPPISSVRDQSLHLVRGRLTCYVLLGDVQANAFRDLGFEWRGDMQTNLFQPVWIDK